MILNMNTQKRDLLSKTQPSYHYTCAFPSVTSQDVCYEAEQLLSLQLRLGPVRTNWIK